VSWPIFRIRTIMLLGAATSLALPQGAGARLSARQDVISLGRNANQEPCLATRAWKDEAAPDRFAISYFITCRNVTASRPLGVMRIVEASAEALAPIDATFDCGATAPITIAGIQGTARRCQDKLLTAETVRVDIVIGKQRLVADAALPLLGPLEEGIAIVTGRKSGGGDAGRETKSTIDVASLPAGPAASVEAAAASHAFDPSVALAQGISLNHKGLHVEASRVLNDALSRLPGDAEPATRAELSLEAGLADSNISFADSAKDHFAEADQLMAENASARTTFLQRKRDAYHALDLLNRRQFRESLASLDKLVSGQVSADQPLMDPSIIRRLNQSGGGHSDVATAIAIPDSAELSQVVLDAQANWARSVALFAIADEAGAARAVELADKSYRLLQNERIDQGQVLWLGARIERQKGRLAAYKKNWPEALAHFDAALDDLRRGAIASAGTGNEPAIAEASLERASIFAQTGADKNAVRDQYAAAVDAMIASNTSGTTMQNGMEGYLDLLVAEATDGVRPDTYERFFRAIQSSGEPAVARQLSQLQNIVTADPALGTKVRDRAEVEREVTRLRYAIAAATTAKDGSLGSLEAQRQTAEAKLLEIDASLATDSRFRSVDDRPATVDEIRKALRPGEAYLKVSSLSRRAYGVFISADQTFIYRIAATEADRKTMDQIGADVRASIDGQLDAGKLVPFATGKAYVLFLKLTGPAREALMKSAAVVVDPSGPLANLPLGTLVTAFDPKVKPVDPFDFSTTAFLADKITISTAISPRSFLVARALPPSIAKNPFLGLGEHQAPAAGSGVSHMVSVGFGCSVPYELLAALSRDFKPINKQELVVAADALGQTNAPMIVDAAFSDTALEARSDLADYQVLHFATHGLEEGQWGCSKSPPALVTSFGDADSDGLLSFSEIARLRLDANLVVLSACDTASGVKDESLARASGQEESGSTLEGLVRAFLTANARAVLATYWQVSAEQESLDFIKTFYTSARSASIGTALQAAQRDLMHKPAYSHPFYWAPYFVVGDSTKAMLSPPGKAPAVAAR
jgi:CHAT domain-containing protein